MLDFEENLDKLRYCSRASTNKPEYGFSLTRIFPFNDRIYDSVITRKNVCHKKPLFRHICTSNHMFGRAIRDKLPVCIFENFEAAQVKRQQFQNFQKLQEWFTPKIARNKYVETKIYEGTTTKQLAITK